MNLQNIPGTKDYRQCFTNTPGKKIINADYSGMELRVIAQVTDSELMKSFFINGDPEYGEDFHSWVANKSFKIIRKDPDFVVPPKKLLNGDKNPAFKHKKERNAAKALSFKINFGGSAFTLKDDFGVTQDEAQDFIDGYIDAFPGLRENFAKRQKFIVRNGYIEIDSFTGRRWFSKDFPLMKKLYKEKYDRLPKEWNSYPKEMKEDWYAKNDKDGFRDRVRLHASLVSRLKRIGLNYPIQGLAGGITKMACILMRNHIIENNIDDFYLVNVVHDETLSECDEGKKDERHYAALVEKYMSKAGTFFCKEVPMPAEAEIGEYWLH